MSLIMMFNPLGCFFDIKGHATLYKSGTGIQYQTIAIDQGDLYNAGPQPLFSHVELTAN